MKEFLMAILLIILPGLLVATLCFLLIKAYPAPPPKVHCIGVSK